MSYRSTKPPDHYRDRRLHRKPEAIIIVIVVFVIVFIPTTVIVAFSIATAVTITTINTISTTRANTAAYWFKSQSSLPEWYPLSRILVSVVAEKPEVMPEWSNDVVFLIAEYHITSAEDSHGNYAGFIKPFKRQGTVCRSWFQATRRMLFGNVQNRMHLVQSALIEDIRRRRTSEYGIIYFEFPISSVLRNSHTRIQNVGPTAICFHVSRTVPYLRQANRWLRRTREISTKD